MIRFFDLSVPILELSKKFQYYFEQPELKAHHHKSTSSSSSSSSSRSSSLRSSEVQTLCEDEAATIQQAITDIDFNQVTNLNTLIGNIVTQCGNFQTG